MIFKRKKVYSEKGKGLLSVRSWKQIRILTQVIIVSGFLNIGLISFFFYTWIQEKPILLPYEHMPATEEQQQAPLADFRGNVEVVQQFQSMDFDQLVGKLSSRELVEDGYSQRDLALACLVNYHHFNLQRALSGYSLQSRILRIEEGERVENIEIFPALSDEHYLKIVQFIQQERWPLTSQGIFLALKQRDYHEDITLAQAFFLSEEYTSVEMLLARSDVAITKKEVLDIILDSDWHMLADFAQKQRISQDLSSPRRQSFLLNYIIRKSETAAMVMLKTDKFFAAKKLDDARVLEILDQIKVKAPEALWFVQELLTSPRSDEVWKRAAQKLYFWDGEEMVEPYDHSLVLERFISKELIETKAEQPVGQEIQKKDEEEKELIHVVAEGDSLWKIAKLYRVDVQDLKEINGLSSDVIKAGIMLKIP